MGVVVVACIDSVGSKVGSDFVVRMYIKEHTDADTDFDTDWVRTVQDDTILALVHPERAPNFSLSRYQLPFPSRAGILCNLSLHGLLTYKIYKRVFSVYLQPFSNINTPRRDAL